MHNFYMIHIQKQLKDNYDLHFRTLELDIGTVMLAFVETIIDEVIISKSIIEPMFAYKGKTGDIDTLKNEVITTRTVVEVKNEIDAVEKILEGHVVIVYELSDRAICCDVKKYANRNVDIPPTEAVIKGSREGFTESVYTNISLIRKRLKDSQLKCESIRIGEKANTQAVLVYIDQVAPKDLVQYIRREIEKIDKGFILQGGHISEQLATKKTAFDTIAYTEKPDVFCTKISEGKVGIIVEGDSAAITAPCFFMEKFHAPSDYTAVKYIGNFTRIIRWFSFMVAMFVPGLYIALGTHHPSLIPRLLAYRLATTRSGVPFPLFLEYFLLAIFFQILREGGIRLPQPIGQAVSIVGALILGDAAVNAGLTSSITVLLVSLCAIASFLSPAISEALILWSSILILCAVLLGLPGYFIGFVVFYSHLAGLQSCGYPYLFPLSTLRRYKHKDRFMRGDLNDISNNIFKEDQENE